MLLVWSELSRKDIDTLKFLVLLSFSTQKFRLFFYPLGVESQNVLKTISTFKK